MKHVPTLQGHSKSHKRFAFIQGQGLDPILKDMGFGAVALEPFVCNAREASSVEDAHTRADSGVGNLEMPPVVSLMLILEREE
jgi:hypothetical protein